MNRIKVKQTAENGKKISDDGTAAVTSLAPAIKNPRLQNDLEFDHVC